jgi:hypothetical protein
LQRASLAYSERDTNAVTIRLDEMASYSDGGSEAVPVREGKRPEKTLSFSDSEANATYPGEH